MKKRFRFLAAFLFLGGMAALLPARADDSDMTNNPVSSAPVTDPALVAAQYRQVLAQPEYQETAGPDANDALRSWLSRLLSRFGQKFDEFQYAQEMPRFASMMMAVFIAAAMAGLIYVTVRVLRRRMDPKFSARPEAPAEKIFRPPEFYEEELQHAVAAGDWHAAWLASWRQFLSRLETAQLVATDRSRTNREYLAELRRQAATAPALPLVVGVVDAYDRFIYGRHAIAEPEWRTFQGQLDEASLLLHLRDRPQPAPA
jgi:hypothetical protein